MLPQVTGLFRVKPYIPGEMVYVASSWSQHCTSFSVSPNRAVSIQGDWLDWLFLLATFFLSFAVAPVNYKVWMLWEREHPAEEGKRVTENASAFYNVITKQSGYLLAPSPSIADLFSWASGGFFYSSASFIWVSVLMSSGWVQLWKLFSRVSVSYIYGHLHKVVPCSPTCQNDCLASESCFSAVSVCLVAHRHLSHRLRRLPGQMKKM